MKLIKGILFGVDLFNGLIWYALLTVIFGLCVFPTPSGNERLIAVAVAALAAILPDLDFVPYVLIRKDKLMGILILGVGASGACFILALELGKQSLLWLDVAGLLGIIAAISAEKKVKERASHWPIWHHPIPLLLICFGLVWAFTHDFAPQHFWYYELLVLVPLIAHFLHDGLQLQGFPYLSPFTDAHWQIMPFERISPAAVRNHYMAQAAQAARQTTKQDAEKRADKITSWRVGSLAFAVLMVFGIIYL